MKYTSWCQKITNSSEAPSKAIKRIPFGWIALICFVFLASCDSSTNPHEQFIRDFDLLVFGTDADDQKVVNKWTKPLRIGYALDIEDFEAFQLAFRKLSKATGIPIDLEIKAPETANVLMGQVSEAHLRSKGMHNRPDWSQLGEPGFLCGNLVFFDRDHTIKKSLIIVLDDTPPKWHAICGYRSLFETLAPTGETRPIQGKTSTPSIMIHREPRFTELDLRILSVLYRPDIKPGMSRPEVINLLRAQCGRTFDC